MGRRGHSGRPVEVRVALALAVAAGAAAPGCALEIGSPPGALDPVALQADNGIFLDNGLKLTNGANAGNGIKLTNGFNLANGIDLANGIKLTNGVLTIEPPPGSDLERWIDADPTMRLRILRYETACALPDGASVEVIYREQSFTFPGVIGLGPSWLDGLMTSADQEKVSACLLARVNARGDLLRINLVGPYSGMDSLSDEDRVSYPNRETTFVGNLFRDPPRAYIENAFCGSRACKVDLSTTQCDCGIVSTHILCSSETTDYDTGCVTYDISGESIRPSKSTLYQFPITTYVAQERPGGGCTADVDCIYHNCEAGACGAVGAACAWDYMCEAALRCGWDHQCGGTGSACSTGAGCVYGNCAAGMCGAEGATCSASEQCAGNRCSRQTCRACRSDGDCPPETTCFSGGCKPLL